MTNTGLLASPNSQLGNIILGFESTTPSAVPSPVTGDYRFVIADLTGVEKDEIAAVNPIWSYVLNDAGACSLRLPTRDAKATTTLLPVGGCELHIYRGNTIVWGGHLYNIQATAENDVRFGFEGYFSMLNHRYIDTSQNFVGIDQFNIAWNLINFTQTKTNGNIGMGWARFSSSPSGITRDINYPFWERTVIADAIRDLAALHNGFDFEVTATKQWKTYSPSKGTNLSIPIEYGKNVDGFSVGYDVNNMANVYSAIGAGDGKNTCIAVGTDTASQTIYGLREQAESFTEIRHYANLQDRATEGLRMHKNPRIQPTLSVVLNTDPQLYTYSVGDRVNVKVQEGYLNVNQVFRIISITVELSNEGREAVVLNFDDKVDV